MEQKGGNSFRDYLWPKIYFVIPALNLILGDLKLLETGEPLYIPVTQDSVPKTEDQLEEDAQVLLKLGTDALGSELRARLLSAYLLSDMQAFKAANPGCVLGDFIRWCSPRDWIEEENGELDEFGQKKGIFFSFYLHNKDFNEFCF